MKQGHQSHPTLISPGTTTLPVNPQSLVEWGHQQLVNNPHNYSSNHVTLLKILQGLPSHCPCDEDWHADHACREGPAPLCFHCPLQPFLLSISPLHLHSSHWPDSLQSQALCACYAQSTGRASLPSDTSPILPSQSYSFFTPRLNCHFLGGSLPGAPDKTVNACTFSSLHLLFCCIWTINHLNLSPKHICKLHQAMSFCSSLYLQYLELCLKFFHKYLLNE